MYPSKVPSINKVGSQVRLSLVCIEDIFAIAQEQQTVVRLQVRERVKLSGIFTEGSVIPHCTDRILSSWNTVVPIALESSKHGPSVP